MRLFSKKVRLTESPAHRARRADCRAARYCNCMQKNVLITGMPKSGKSTILRRLVENIPNKVGFVTNEVLGADGRVGFEMETHAGNKAVLAHIDLQTGRKVSKYFVDIDSLESLIPEMSDFDNNFIYLDEIGEMQLSSNRFKELVLKYLDSPNPCIATLSSVYEDDFIRGIKKRADVTIVEITPENRDDVERLLIQHIRSSLSLPRF